MSEDVREMVAKGKEAVTLRAGAVEIELVRIPPGEFMMGSPESEEGHAPNEGPVGRVCITKAFYLGRFEITRSQYRAVIEQAPGGPPDDMLPVQHITYANAIEFCRRLSGLANVKIRLPSEAQWEYACRAGTQTRYWSGSTEVDLARVGWYDANSGGTAHSVGQKQPNAWGLYDMHGNVWEYCADFIDDYATMEKTDPVGRITEHWGAMRGGGWMHGLEECRSATRMISDDMFGGAGFRIAIDTY
jgi:formylglycine-generating enzyme required for sulfatase activity